MKIKIGDGGVILCSLTLNHKGTEKVVHNLVLDTGAAETIVYRHAVRELDIYLDEGDEFVFMRGIGGRETALRKSIHSIEFLGFTASDFPIDFGDVRDENEEEDIRDSQPMAEDDVNGLLGLDILHAGHFIIDLNAMEIYSEYS